MAMNEYGSNNRWSGSLITRGGIYAAGTTYYDTQRGSAATALDAGSIKANSYVEAGSYLKATTYVQSTTGFKFAAGDAKLFACGTYIGSGAATAAIKVSSLTTIHHVWMNLRTGSRTAVATTRGRIIPSPALAASTVGSFYPIVYRTAATNKEINLGTGSGATYSWFAVGV